MNAEAQRRALSASQKSAFSVFANEGDDEGSSNVVKVAPVQGDLRRVEYSAEMAEIDFPPQNGDQRDSPRERQHPLDQLSLQGVSQTSGYLCQSAVEANLKTDMETDEEVIRGDETSTMNGKEELEQLSQTSLCYTVLW